MRIEQLDYILEVANKGSIGVAADSLYITQQSLSQSIKNLEKELGITLFDRTKSGVTSTEAGELFCQFARDTLANLSELKAQFLKINAHDSEIENQRLIIDMNKIYDYAIVPNALKNFQKSFSNVNITSNSKDITTIYQELEFLSYDDAKDYIAFVNLPCIEDKIIGNLYVNDEFIFHPILDGKFDLCVNKSSSLAKKKIISLVEAAKYPIIFLSSGIEFKSNTGLFFKYYDIENIDAAVSTSSLNIWFNCIAENLGIGFLHNIMFEKSIESLILDKHTNDIAVLSLEEPLRGILGYIVHKDCSETVKNFLDYIPEYGTSSYNINFNGQ